MILYNSPSWNSMKRNPITSSKHNNTMFKGILLINIYNEISKRKDEYPVPLISGSATHFWDRAPLRRRG